MTTLIVLHGWEHSRESWLTGFADHVPGANVVAFDLPGFGAEPLVSTEWGVPEYAAWARKKIESLGVNDIVLLGHSFGGRIAAVLASEHPAWLKGLILSGAPCLYRPTVATKIRIRLAKIAKRSRVLSWLFNSMRNPDLIQADEKGIGAIFRKAVSFDQTAMVKAINVPTLLIWGEYDRDYAPLRIAREINTLISGSKLLVIEGVGHNAHLENPTLFYGYVTNFLKNF